MPNAESRTLPTAGPVGNVFAVWRRLTLARQFVVAACAISLLSVFALGMWVTKKIEQSAIESAATSVALYVGHFVSPHLQGLASRSQLSQEEIAAIDEVMKSAALRMRVSTIKVWGRGGLILYSSNKADIGKRFAPDETQQKAWDGNVGAEYDRLDHEESAAERALNIPLYEVYVPIFLNGSTRVLAVVEFYQSAEPLQEQLSRARWQSWLITGLIAATMLGALSSIVADGSKTIELQREALTDRIDELSQLLTENRHLYSVVEASSRQAIENNERFLREIGSDLHDGPAQLLALALLKLDSIKSASTDENAAQLHGTLSGALQELRDICAGLVLPDIPSQNLQEALLFVVRYHTNRTGTEVAFESRDLPETVSPELKNCFCRFVQECLNNAYRHAGGKGQKVRAWSDANSISVEVSDKGPGMAERPHAGSGVRLGLVCLRDRVESLGGRMTIASHPGQGVRVTATIAARGDREQSTGIGVPTNAEESSNSSR